MYKATVTANRIRVENPDNEIMTSGSVNVNFIEFVFSEDWRGLLKTVLFQTKKALLPIILEGDELTYTMPIPWEVLVYAGEQINVGAYGTRVDDEETPEDEEIIMPTVWGSIPDKVKQGVIVSDPTPSSPTYNAYLYLLQLLEEIVENGGGGGGTLDHSKLTNRDLEDQHPIEAISGLTSKFTEITGIINELSSKAISSHNDLSDRDSLDQHPIKSIAGLNNELETLGRQINGAFSAIKDLGDSIPSVTDGSVLFTRWPDGEPPVQSTTRQYSTSDFVGKTPVPSNDLKGGLMWTDGGLYLVTYKVVGVAGESVEIDFVENVVLIGPVSGDEGIPLKPITSSDYSLLTPEEKMAEIAYLVTDGGGSSAEPSVNGDIYSEEEVQIGTWIDGKPLYRRVFKATSPSTVKSWTNLGHYDSNLEIVKLDSLVKRSAWNGYVSEALPCFGINSEPYLKIVWSSATLSNGIGYGFNIYVGDSIYGNQECIVILMYTKANE